MTYRRIYHTHPNPKQGRNEPLLVEVEGWDCPDCQEPRDDVKLPGAAPQRLEEARV